MELVTIRNASGSVVNRAIVAQYLPSDDLIPAVIGLTCEQFIKLDYRLTRQSFNLSQPLTQPIAIIR